MANVNDGKLIDVKFDPKHPVTAGCGCIKGKHVPDYQNDPDRLLYPQKKLGDSWQQITWDGAIEEIGTKLNALATEHGPTAISTYWVTHQIVYQYCYQQHFVMRSALQIP